MESKIEPLIEYLGDGLYAEFKNDMIGLKANDPENPTDIVWLEFDVCENFFRYAKRCYGLE